MKNRTIILSTIAFTLLGSAAAVFAQGQQPQMPMSFFIAANPTGTGNLGGLEGADRICQNAAMAAGAGNRTWHAYLSQEQRGTTPRVNARGRIGNGPTADIWNGFRRKSYVPSLVGFSEPPLAASLAGDAAGG